MNRVYLYEKPTCCGFIQSEYNTTLSCFIWGGLSFYFAVLAFLNKSPFYSYISTVPLVAFGAANLLLGITSLVSSIVFILKRRMEREFQTTQNIYFRYRSNRISYAVGLSVVAVLITALVSFILFVAEKQDFLDWCITSSTSYVNATYNEVNTASNLSAINLSASVDYYNCERLFQDEVKWGLMCLAVLFTVYLHWIVILYTVRSSHSIFDNHPNIIIRTNMLGVPAPIVDGEYNNIPPKKKSISSLSSIKPSKLRNEKFKLFQKKTIYGAKLPTQNEIEKSASDHSINKTEYNDILQKDGDNSNNQGGNTIYFEDNIYNSKEEVIDPIENRQTERAPSQRSGSVATLVNMSD